MPLSSLPGYLKPACRVLDDLSTESGVRALMISDLADAIAARKGHPNRLTDPECRFLLDQTPVYFSAMVSGILQTQQPSLIEQLDGFLQAMSGKRPLWCPASRLSQLLSGARSL